MACLRTAKVRRTWSAKDGSAAATSLQEDMATRVPSRSDRSSTHAGPLAPTSSRPELPQRPMPCSRTTGLLPTLPRPGSMRRWLFPRASRSSPWAWLIWPGPPRSTGPEVSPPRSTWTPTTRSAGCLRGRGGRRNDHQSACTQPVLPGPGRVLHRPRRPRLGGGAQPRPLVPCRSADHVRVELVRTSVSSALVTSRRVLVDPPPSGSASC